MFSCSDVAPELGSGSKDLGIDLAEGQRAAWPCAYTHQLRTRSTDGKHQLITFSSKVQLRAAKCAQIHCAVRITLAGPAKHGSASVLDAPFQTCFDKHLLKHRRGVSPH